MRPAVMAAMLGAHSATPGLNGLSLVGDSNTQFAAPYISIPPGSALSLASSGLLSIEYASTAPASIAVGERVTVNSLTDHTLELTGIVVTSSTLAITIQTTRAGGAASETVSLGNICRTTGYASSNWVGRVRTLIPALTISGHHGNQGFTAGVGVYGLRGALLMACAEPGDLLYYSGGTNNIVGSAQSASVAYAAIESDIDAALAACSKEVIVAAVPPIGAAAWATDTQRSNALEVNSLLSAKCAGNARLHFADINTPLLVSGSTTGLGDNVYLPDGLHYNTDAGAVKVGDVLAAVIGGIA